VVIQRELEQHRRTDGFSPSARSDGTSDSSIGTLALKGIPETIHAAAVAWR